MWKNIPCEELSDWALIYVSLDLCKSSENQININKTINKVNFEAKIPCIVTLLIT